MSGEVKHDYHLVEPSKWPFVASMFVFMMALGAVFWMDKDTYELPFMGYLFFAGLLGVVYVAYEWWADVVKEAHQGDHTPTVQLGLRYGMILFIASEVMFFVAWFWAFFNGSLDPMVQDAAGEFLAKGPSGAGIGVWPPVGIETFDPWHIPFLNTVILLLSGTTVTWAHHALIEGDRESLKKGLWLTCILGATFTGFQVYEYIVASFAFAGNIYGSTFYMATGFHGFHVFVGTIFLIVCLVRSYKGHFKPEQHFGFEAAAWYWHFVDVVWLFLFVSIYWWGGA
jgi:cytochrome c oxidase subunit 3